MKVSLVHLGRSTKSAGGLTFTNWKGIKVAKAKITNPANPNSPLQQLQRKKFKFAVAFFKLCSAIINIGFRSQENQKSAYNVFQSINTKNGAFSGDQVGLVADPSLLQIAKGSLTPTVFIDATHDAVANTIRVKWNPALIGNQKETDSLSVMVVGSDGEVIVQGTSGVGRSAQFATFACPALVNPIASYVVLAFHSTADRRNSCDSQVMNFS